MSEEVEEEEEGAPEWITTFADLMSLLLTFFILMLSFSSMKAEKLKEMATAIQQSMGITQNQFSKIKQDFDTPSIVDREGKLKGSQGADNKTLKKIKDFISSKGFAAKVSIDTKNRGIVMRINDSLLFLRGESKIRKAAIPVLENLAKTIRNKPFFVSVEGHTDSTPIKSIKYPSNWELGGDRAGSIANYLISEGHMSPRRFRVVSHGSTSPLVKNSTKKNRSRNRRVEIILSREKS